MVLQFLEEFAVCSLDAVLFLLIVFASFLQKQKHLWFVNPCNFLENQFCKELLLYIVFVENKIEFQNLTRMKLKYNGF